MLRRLFGKKEPEKSFVEKLEEIRIKYKANHIMENGQYIRADGNIEGLNVRLVAFLRPQKGDCTLSAFQKESDITFNFKKYPTPEKCLKDFEDVVNKYNLRLTKYED